MQMAGGDGRIDQVNILEVKHTRVPELATIIKAISFRENGTFQATPQGMRILVDDHHCEQAIAYLSNDLFARFDLRERSVHFRVPLNLITECIAMHTGPGATLKMAYDGESVKLILEDDGMVVDMKVHTLTTEEVLDFEFDSDDVTFQTIMKPYMIKEAIRELDASSSLVTLSVSSEELLLITKGDIGKAVTKFPRYSEQFERFECTETVTHQYLIGFIKNMSAAFAIATKVSLRCDSRGVLSVQFMVEQAEHKQIYIEYYCAPHIDE